jgi:pyridoxine 5-phosphate synthase
MEKICMCYIRKHRTWSIIVVKMIFGAMPILMRRCIGSNRCGKDESNEEIEVEMKLGVNIDHVATLRQVRGTVYPDPVDAAIMAARAGAHGITAHLREDRRHIQDEDIFRLKSLQPLPLNLEMANVPEIVDLAVEINPDEVCLVPEKRQELTTEGGLDVLGQYEQLCPTVDRLLQAGIEVSLFVEPDTVTLEACRQMGVSVVELHTGSYCDADVNEQPDWLEKLITGAESAHELGLQVNAGHGITTDNIGGILCVPHLAMLNIGHSLVSRAVFLGMQGAVEEMLAAMAEYQG